MPLYPPRTKVDLHMHSTISDGTLPPKELVQLAAQAKLEVISLTDHDAIDGLDDAHEEAKLHGIRLIDGVELSAAYSGGSLHVLGYHFDRKDPLLLETLERYQSARSTRNHQIMERLKELGIHTDYAELEAIAPGNKSLGRAHIAKLLVDKGVVKNMDRAFAEYLNPGKKAFIDKEFLTPTEAVQLIKKAGGIAVVAHPVTLRIGIERLGRFLLELKEAGLDGLEAYSTAQDRSHCNRYARLAKELGLMITGGSDFHGSNKKNVVIGRLQDRKEIHYEMLSEEFFHMG